MYELKRLNSCDGLEIYNLLQEIPREENGLRNSANGISYKEYEEWLINKEFESKQNELIDGWKVPSTMYWLYVDEVPVGYGIIRHFLTEPLKKAGGHISYAISPPNRGKGYGKELLRLLLMEAKYLGLTDILITIKNDNIASQNVAKANGGKMIEKNNDILLYIVHSTF